MIFRKNGCLFPRENSSFNAILTNMAQNSLNRTRLIFNTCQNLVMLKQKEKYWLNKKFKHFTGNFKQFEINTENKYDQEI